MSNVISLDDVRRNKELDKAADAIMDDLGIDVEQLAEVLDTAPDNIRKNILEALERKQAIEELQEINAEEDEASGIMADECHNMVCPKYVQIQHKSIIKENNVDFYKYSGKSNYCKDGKICAQGCLYRMKETPPITDPFQTIPSHAEAIRILQREGKLKPDDFGQWNGTDFIFHKNVRALWTAYINLLAETGKIDHAVFELEDGTKTTDFAEMQKRARNKLLNQDK